MALRKLGRLIRVSTKAGLGGGTVYLYYKAGLWKGADETIENYDKLRKDMEILVNANPDVKKWMEYAASSVNSSIKPYSEAVSDFRKEWLNFDISGLGSPINGVVKPAWNKGFAWSIEAIANSPETIPKLGASGWQKVTELFDPQTESSKTDGTSAGKK